MIFSSEQKYRNIKLNQEQADGYKSKIVSHYETEKPFLNNEYSLTKLSEDVNIPKHLLSLVFSTQIKMGFVDFTNGFRVEEAKHLLVDNPNYTISSVAFDSGFNSVSSFNQAFKKSTKITPSKYRDLHSIK